MTARARFTETTEDGFRVYVIECPESKTRVAVPLGMPIVRVGPLVEGLALHHEEKCGRCSLDRVRKKHGDEAFRLAFDAWWDQYEAEQRNQWFAEHRN